METATAPPIEIKKRKPVPSESAETTESAPAPAPAVSAEVAPAPAPAPTPAKPAVDPSLPTMAESAEVVGTETAPPRPVAQITRRHAQIKRNVLIYNKLLKKTSDERYAELEYLSEIKRRSPVQHVTAKILMQIRNAEEAGKELFPVDPADILREEKYAKLAKLVPTGFLEMEDPAKMIKGAMQASAKIRSFLRTRRGRGSEVKITNLAAMEKMIERVMRRVLNKPTNPKHLEDADHPIDANKNFVKSSRRDKIQIILRIKSDISAAMLKLVESQYGQVTRERLVEASNEQLRSIFTMLRAAYRDQSD